jgi:hypothetical protein
MLIQRAETATEYQEVRRFWYQIYCVIRGVLKDKANHDTQELDDPLLGKGKLFFGRNSAGLIVGTVMTTYAKDSDLDGYREFYELGRLEESFRSIAIVTKFMAAPDKRGTGLALSLLRAVTTAGLQDGITHAVYDANPPTDELFRRVGGIDWLGRKRHPEFGDVQVMMTRLVEDAHNRKYLQKVSP